MRIDFNPTVDVIETSMEGEHHLARLSLAEFLDANSSWLQDDPNEADRLLENLSAAGEHKIAGFVGGYAVVRCIRH